MNPNPYETFRTRMKERRTLLNITLTEIAEALDISQPTAQRYESGEIKNIPYDKLALLAEYCSAPLPICWVGNPWQLPRRIFPGMRNACSVISGS